MDIGTLIGGTGARLVDPSAATTRVCDVTDDSRSVMPGSLFIARPGTASDGRDHIAQALRAGADSILTVAGTPRPQGTRSPGAWAETETIAIDTAKIAESFYDNPSSKLSLIGVTGTNGKTTIVHTLRSLLAGCSDIPTGLISTIEIDDGQTVSPATLTTPGAIELSYTLSTMVEHGVRAVAIEASSHALDQERVGALDFEVAIFSNLTGDHLDYHKTIESYARAKAKLFSMLTPEALAIVNIDDPHASIMLDACKADRVLRCSMNGAGDCNARILQQTRSGTTVELDGPFGRLEVCIPLVGAHNAMNVLQAVAALHEVCDAPAELAGALESLQPPPGRLERVRANSGRGLPFSVFVDFAHTDDALRSTLRSLRPLADDSGGALHVVFGCGGDRDRTKRPRMAEVCCEFADRVTITSDNPRTEPPASIIREILAGVPEGASATVDIDADREVAISRAIERARREDIVLIAGKGHETEQILPDGKGGVHRVHFDDREVARAALNRIANTGATPNLGVSP